MVVNDIKQNINKIDFDLKNLFENVYITEKSLGNQFYFEINANSTFFNLNESLSWKRVEANVIINKIDILSNNIRWFYSPNPLNESVSMVERNSTIDKIAYDIYNVIIKGKMDKKYLSDLEDIVESINEGVEHLDKTFMELVTESINKYGVEITSITSEDKITLENNNFMDTKPDQCIIFNHNSNIKMSDMFKIEGDIKSILGVDSVIFKEGYIEVRTSQI